MKLYLTGYKSRANDLMSHFKEIKLVVVSPDILQYLVKLIQHGPAFSEVITDSEYLIREIMPSIL